MKTYEERVKETLEPEFIRLGIVDEQVKQAMIAELIALANLVIDTYPNKKKKTIFHSKKI